MADPVHPRRRLAAGDRLRDNEISYENASKRPSIPHHGNSILPQCHADHNYRRILGVGRCSFALCLPFWTPLRTNAEVVSRRAEARQVEAPCCRVRPHTGQALLSLAFRLAYRSPASSNARNSNRAGRSRPHCRRFQFDSLRTLILVSSRSSTCYRSRTGSRPGTGEWPLKPARPLLNLMFASAIALTCPLIGVPLATHSSQCGVRRPLLLDGCASCPSAGRQRERPVTLQRDAFS